MEMTEIYNSRNYDGIIAGGKLPIMSNQSTTVEIMMAL